MKTRIQNKIASYMKKSYMDKISDKCNIAKK